MVLPAALRGPLPVGAVHGGRVGVAAAGGLAASDVPLDEGAGQGEAEAGRGRGWASSAAMRGSAGVLSWGERHVLHGGRVTGAGRISGPGRVGGRFSARMV